MYVHRSVEENTIVFDDNHEKSPEPLDEVPKGSTSDSDKSSQVQTNAGNIQVKLDSGMINHQQLTTTTATDNNTTHSAESSGHNKSPHKTENNKQCLGEKSLDNVSDKKFIEPSNEGEETAVLGLRFTGVMDAQSENKMNENTNEDGDLLEDKLECVNFNLRPTVYKQTLLAGVGRFTKKYWILVCRYQYHFILKLCNSN